MGMKIDDHIEVLKSYNHGFTGYVGNIQDSIDVAIDTMRKYQKIQEIIEDWNNEQINNIICCLDIKKVVENGNDDC